jgi:hypothetical protein
LPKVSHSWASDAKECLQISIATASDYFIDIIGHHYHYAFFKAYILSILDYKQKSTLLNK